MGHVKITSIVWDNFGDKWVQFNGEPLFKCVSDELGWLTLPKLAETYGPLTDYYTGQPVIVAVLDQRSADQLGEDQVS